MRRPRTRTRQIGAPYVAPQAKMLTAAALLLPALAVPARPAGFPRFPTGCSRHDVRSGAITIRAELCLAGFIPRRAVVVLHGCGGFSTFDHRLVTGLPRFGISTLDLDYFVPTAASA